jgi:hypothetical protein
MNNNIYFKNGLFIGLCSGLLSASLTYLLTNDYINKHYMLIPKNMASYIEAYQKYK